MEAGAASVPGLQAGETYVFNVVASCEGACLSWPAADPQRVAYTVSSAVSMPPDYNKPGGAGGLSKGVLAGLVVGGIVLLGVAAALVVSVRRGRLLEKQLQYEMQVTTPTLPHHPHHPHPAPSLACSSPDAYGRCWLLASASV